MKTGSQCVQINGEKIGIDIRNDASYILAEPSRIFDKSYKWISTIEDNFDFETGGLPQMPNWLEFCFTKNIIYKDDIFSFEDKIQKRFITFRITA